MNPELYDVQKAYREALQAFLAGAETPERPLLEAYTIGRRAMTDGLGLLDLVTLHHRVLMEVVCTGCIGESRSHYHEAAAQFLREVMAPYEMTHRGFRDATELLRRAVLFGAMLCHQLQTPLTSVVLSASMLKEVLNLHPDTPEAKLLENVLSSGAILEKRTDDLRDVVGFLSGTLNLNVTTVDIGSFLRGVCQRLEPEVSHAGLVLSLDAPQGLPSLLGDPARLEQVVANLVDNAVKYAADGGRIDVRAMASDNAVVLEVQDYGRGISIWDRMRLFVPFYRPQHGQQDPPGLGVGLALCQQVVVAHGGTISVDSEAGKGTRFRVSLPLPGIGNRKVEP